MVPNLYTSLRFLRFQANFLEVTLGSQLLLVKYITWNGMGVHSSLRKFLRILIYNDFGSSIFMPKLKCISSESPDEISRFLEVHVWLYSFVQSINHRTDLRKKICTLAISRFFFLALKKNAIKSHGQLWSWTPVQFTLEPL